MRQTILAAMMAVGLTTGLTAAASAAVITTDLNVISSAGIGSGSLGAITVTDIAGGVTVNVALRSGINFLETGGPHTAFAFNLNAPYTSITNVNPSAYNVFLSNAAATPYGTFAVGLECGSCGNGAPSSIHGPLSFQVNGVSTTNFVANSSGYIFAADLLNTANGSTGSVANGTVTRTTTTTPTPTPVPEPASLLLFGAGLVGLGVVRRRKAA